MQKSTVGHLGLSLVRKGPSSLAEKIESSPARLLSVDFTRHSQADLYRAVLEGVAFSFVEGMDIMRTLGIRPGVIRAGEANMFLSPIFCEALATVSDVAIELYNADGSQGAARGAAYGAGAYSSLDEIARGLSRVRTIEPSRTLSDSYHEAFGKWRAALEIALNSNSSGID